MQPQFTKGKHNVCSGLVPTERRWQKSLSVDVNVKVKHCPFFNPA